MSNERKPHKHCEVIKAWAEGRQVQVRDRSNEEWSDLTNPNPNWFESNEYRVKPETVRYRVALIKGRIGIETCSLTEKVRWQLTPEKFEDQDCFLKWIDADWQEVEI